MEEAREDIVTLVDDEGHEHAFTVVDIIEVDEKEYALLMPLDAEHDHDHAGHDHAHDHDEETEDVLVLRFEGDSLVMIEDEEEFKRVVEYLDDMVPEMEGADVAEEGPKRA